MTTVYPQSVDAVLPPRVAKVAVANEGGFDVPDHVAGELCARFGFTTGTPAASIPIPVLLVQGSVEAVSVGASVSVTVEDQTGVTADSIPEPEPDPDASPQPTRRHRR